jgi:hypothetical protein
MSIADELRKLQELHQSGSLTCDEFAAAKASVLRPLNKVTATEREGEENLTPVASLPLPLPEPQTNQPIAQAGFILGLVSIVLYPIGLIPIFAIIFSVLGFFGFDDKKHKNGWMMVAGTLLGIVYTLVFFNEHHR